MTERALLLRIRALLEEVIRLINGRLSYITVGSSTND